MTTTQLTAMGALAALAAAAFFYYWIKTNAGDDGPIRVKGGSVFIDGAQNWVPGAAGSFKYPSNNTNLHDAVVDVRLDGVVKPPTQVHGKVIQLDIEDPVAGGPGPHKITIGVQGGVSVKNGRLTAAGKRLSLTGPGVYITEVRVLGGASPTTYGPFTKRESEVLEIDIMPL